jgi:hypothetical protein
MLATEQTSELRPKPLERFPGLASTLLACLAAAGVAAACTGDRSAIAPDETGEAQDSSSGHGSSDVPAGTRPEEEDDDDEDEEELEFSESRLLIEHNATAQDTGFQGFVDGEPWNRLEIVAPGGAAVLSVKGVGPLRALGMTELFFETQEPPNAEVPIEELLARFPEGEYEFEGRSIDGLEVEGGARLTHAIPAGPEIVSPLEDAVVDPADAVVTWNAVTETINGAPVEIVGYELIVEEDIDAPPLPGFSRTLLSIHVPPAVTSLSIPPEFLVGGTAYKFEVLALEASGNQTISEGTFETAE